MGRVPNKDTVRKMVAEIKSATTMSQREIAFFVGYRGDGSSLSHVIRGAMKMRGDFYDRLRLLHGQTVTKTIRLPEEIGLRGTKATDREQLSFGSELDKSPFRKNEAGVAIRRGRNYLSASHDEDKLDPELKAFYGLTVQILDRILDALGVER